MTQPPFQADELAMVNAIHDDPRSDRPRLAYADWLDARGERDLAEFIRIQCAEPHFTLDKQGIEEATVSHDTSWITFEDPDRAAAAIRLLSRLHPGDRFPDPRLWQEYTRGLPLYAEELYDNFLDNDGVDYIRGVRSPLARYRLHVYTYQLSEWLAHPILRRTDEFRVFPIGAGSGLSQAEFTAAEINTFAKSALLDHLETIGLCGPLTEEARKLARALLEPRVSVSYEY